MSDNTSKIIVSLLGVAGLILYGYLIFLADVSAEYQKYTVIVASLGVLYPLISLIDNEHLTGNAWKAIGIGSLGACLILLAGYGAKVNTNDGLGWDFFNAISTEHFRMFYLIILVIANVVPLISKKFSVWVSSLIIGLMIPVIIASLIALAIVAIGLAILNAAGKSNNSSNSWSSLLTNSSGSSNKGSGANKNSFIQTKGNDNRRYAYLIIRYARSVDESRNTDSLYKASEALPLDFTFDQISTYLKKKYGLGYDPVIVNTRVHHYIEKDGVDPYAYKI